MGHAITLALLIAGLYLLIRKRQHTKAVTRVGDREVWAQASDTRFPRLPSNNPFRSRRRLK